MKHSLANYPKKFLGCVISPTKICMQFENVTSKLRFKEGADYIKSPDTVKALPIKITGTEVDILAVGTYLPVLEECQRSLIKSYLAYGLEHNLRYQQEYGKKFLDFLKEIQNELSNTVEELERRSSDEVGRELPCCQARRDSCRCASTTDSRG